MHTQRPPVADLANSTVSKILCQKERPPPLRPQKRLTPDERRDMCKYAEAQPGIKQDEMALLFGVERR